ncbi:alpha/beta hydrolase [Flavobacterium psychrotrophum]|uniref:alpha/beta hydrolase n=1 Tax=Flavobacterium psychrotrophum TaxID=2294119 RepID=UPI000E3153DB|nr:alpha/beta hydrolase-fold protein [Flavobacterium psychrotrophum]
MKRLFIFALLALLTLPCMAQKTNTIKPFILGHQTEIKSKILGEKRVLNIYVPDGYNAKDTVTYPVIYLLDGSTDEDFLHISGLVQYSSFEWVNYIPKSIVVGIATVNRKRDFTFASTVGEQMKAYPEAGHSDKFIAFIEKELQPFISKNYQVGSSKTIIGQSMGGLLETEILFKNPELFSRYIIISPSLWWDNGSLLNTNPEILGADFKHPTEVYIGVGKEGLAPTTAPHVMEVDANLLAEKIKGSKSSTVKVIFDYLPSEDHATIMHQATLNAFKLLMAK